jgi:hypothetical protein
VKGKTCAIGWEKKPEYRIQKEPRTDRGMEGSLSQLADWVPAMPRTLDQVGGQGGEKQKSEVENRAQVKL